MSFMHMQQQSLGTTDFSTGYEKQPFSSEKSKWWVLVFFVTRRKDMTTASLFILLGQIAGVDSFI